MAPNAAPYTIAYINVVTRVVRRRSGDSSARKLGRLSVPAARLSAHVGDSGRKGRSSMSGMAGITPDIRV